MKRFTDKEVSLSLGISTVGDRVSELPFIFEKCNHDDFDEIIIVVQKCNREKIKDLFASLGKIKNLRIFLDKKIGLSRSRNIVLNVAGSDYLWFVDDDVQIAANAVRDLKNIIRKERGKIILAKAKCSDSDRSYRKPRLKGDLSKLYLCRTSSIEIVAPRKKLINNKIYFDERIGLGTNVPTGEEVLVLLECFDKGIKIHDCGQFLISHPCNDNKRPAAFYAQTELLLMRGILARRVGLILGLPLTIKWGIHTLKYKKRISVFYHLFRGFLMNDIEKITGSEVKSEIFNTNSRWDYQQVEE